MARALRLIINPGTGKPRSLPGGRTRGASLPDPHPAATSPRGSSCPALANQRRLAEAASGSCCSWLWTAAKRPRAGPGLLSALPRQGTAHPAPHPHHAAVRQHPSHPPQSLLPEPIVPLEAEPLRSGRWEGKFSPGKLRQSRSSPRGCRSAAGCQGTRRCVHCVRVHGAR